MKPTILVDMDGPLADFDLRFFERCAAAGWLMDIEGPHLQRHRFAADHIPDREHRRLARQMVDTEPWFRTLPVVEGAVQGLNVLAEYAEVWICTKPLEVNATCRDDKAAWLEEHFGPEWLQRLIITPDKSMVRGDVLLDDAPKSAWFDRADWRPVIFPTPYNGEGSDWGGLPSWSWTDDVGDLLDLAS